jgi:hypothetical protein
MPTPVGMWRGIQAEQYVQSLPAASAMNTSALNAAFASLLLLASRFAWSARSIRSPHTL